jgi:hypothetical protein
MGSNPFSARVVACLVGAGIVAFAAFMILMAYAPDFRSGKDGRPHALSVSAVGFHGIVELIGLTGGHAELIRDESLLDTEDLVVATLEPYVDPEIIDAFADRRQGKVTLLVLPKWAVMAEPGKKGWVRSLGTFGGAATGLIAPLGKVRVHEAAAGARMAAGLDMLTGLRVPLPAKVQTIAGADVVPLIAGPGGRAILGRVGDGHLYVLADPDLLNNMGLKDPARARAALGILESLNSTGAKSVAFDLTLNGLVRRPSVLKLAFEPPFVALTLAIFVAALLAGLHGAFRFGPATREGRAIAFGKAALVENSAGLFRIARREHRTGEAYADLIREEAAHASAAADLRGDALDAYLDRFSAADRPRFTELARQAAAAGDRNHLVSAARALFLWKKDLIK